MLWVWTFCFRVLIWFDNHMSFHFYLRPFFMWAIPRRLKRTFKLCKPFVPIIFDFIHSIQLQRISSLRQFWLYDFSVFQFTVQLKRMAQYLFNTLFQRWFGSINSKTIWNERKSYETKSIIKYGHSIRALGFVFVTVSFLECCESRIKNARWNQRLWSRWFHWSKYWRAVRIFKLQFSIERPMEPTVLKYRT